tara:strand:- start:3873 stop:6134 length:2262 start_codon:yes stop_codon:yes gene_type:complete
MKFQTPLVLLMALPFAAWAEEDAEATFGHSVHGEVFNEGPRQAAVLIPGTGDVHFPISTKVAETQQFFDQGVGQLHGFWDFEAERSFRQASALDPECAMPYWGMAMANFDNAKRAREFVAKAGQRIKNADERETLWIQAIAKYYENLKIDEKKRRRDLVRAQENIVLKYPDDVEAKAFLMKQIYKNSGKGLPVASHLAVNLLLDEIFRLAPNHPAHHYRIHHWDRENAARALESAAKLGPAAPGIAHMWHMPGHIYSKLHRYDDAIWQQEASARVDHAHMMRFRMTPDRIGNFAHNNEWLIRNFNHLGQVQRAVDLATNMIELPRLPKLKDEVYDHGGGSWNLGRQRLRDTLLRYEEWDRLLEFGDSAYLQPGSNTINDSEWHRFMGIAAFESGNLDRGETLLAAVDASLTKLREEQTEAVKKAEIKNEETPEKDRKKAIEAAKKTFKTKIDGWEKAQKELQAYQLITAPSPDLAAAEKALDELKSMGKSRKARWFAKLGKFEKALKLANEDVSASKNQVYPLAIQSWVAWLADKPKEAEAAFEKLRVVGHTADQNHPVFARISPIAKAMGVDGDWRLPQEPAPDLGERPPLDSLGPFRWKPSSAPEWTLLNSEDKPISLADYSGKPVILIFFLGRGCTHCMEQLNQFTPFQATFAEAGIDLLAISTDTPEGLRQMFTENGENPFPFPLVSDADLQTFKSYRAHDDFEDQPLHGTFLIDEIGRIRWQEISFEPFTHPEFLLEESKRLLSYPDT